MTTTFMVLLCVAATQLAQAPATTSAPEAPSTPAAPQTSAALPEPEYRIGADDALSVAVLQAPELNVTVRVSEAGEIALPLLGTVRASGLTAQDLALEIATRLQARYIREPDVRVQVNEVRSRGVSVVGASRRPGMIQIRSTATLLEVLSLAGGLSEDAGDTLVVLRKTAAATHTMPPVAANAGMQPPADIRDQRQSEPGMLEVNLKALMDSRDAALDVPIYPGDVVNVRSADIVYVIGAIKKPGSFAMRGNDRLTVLRALALGEGAVPTAATGDAVVLRTTARGERVEIPVNLDAILKGRTPDVMLEAQDVLFVPQSGGKIAARATLDTLTRLLTFKLFP